MTTHAVTCGVDVCIKRIDVIGSVGISVGIVAVAATQSATTFTHVHLHWHFSIVAGICVDEGSRNRPADIADTARSSRRRM